MEKIYLKSQQNLAAMKVNATHIKNLQRGVVTVFDHGKTYSLSKAPTEWQQSVVKVTEEYGIFVYAVIHDVSMLGECLTFLCILPEVYEAGVNDVQRVSGPLFNVFSYVVNMEIASFSEFGFVTLFEGNLLRFDTHPEYFKLDKRELKELAKSGKEVRECL